MRGKRAKQYRKLMQQYGMSFGFREPYQVLVDAEMLQDAERFKMDLVDGLKRTLQGEIKPMITQCSMRHLYSHSSEPGASALIDKAKSFERRRCDHRPEEYPDPLSTRECLCSVVDPKDSKTNKHRYVVASQDLEVRKNMRGIKGVPLVYINRSVMIMEPMAGATVDLRNADERGKFRDGIKSNRGREATINVKRKRDDDGDGDRVGQNDGDADGGAGKGRNRKRARGPKGPNPLAVKKSKKKAEANIAAADTQLISGDVGSNDSKDEPVEAASGKRKRKRKHKTGGGDEEPVGVEISVE